MLRRLAVAAILLLIVPAMAFAQETAKTPEQVLSADTILYFRFDGMEPHRAAYDKTALAEVMRGDLGTFLDYLVTALKDNVAPQLVGGQLLQGIPPDQLQKIQAGVNQIGQVFTQISDRGFVIGVELISLEPPRVQVTVIFPNTAKSKHPKAIPDALNLAISLAKAEVKESKIDGRTVSIVQKIDPVTVAWWQEGNHTVITAGTEKVDDVLGCVSGKRPNLTTAALFKSITDFKKYETWARGFIDLERAVKFARFRKEATQIIDDLGLDGLKNLTLQFGFEGRYDRSTIVLNLKGPRKGILRLASAPDKFEVSDLPPIPPDSTRVSAMHFDLATLYDVALEATQSIVKVVDPETLPQVQEAIKQMDKAIGINLRKDLLEALEPTIVTYDSWAEGFFYGSAVAIKVKNEKKLQEALDTMFKALPAATGADISVRKRTYRDAHIHTVHVALPGFFFVPSYTIHKGWFVVAFYPQPVQGFILRSTGKYSTWKPTPLLDEVLKEIKKDPKAKVTSISVSDPRSTLKILLSIAPIVGGFVNSFAPGTFDPFMIPNTYSVIEPLFPNVSVSVDDGDSIRMESYASLSFPF